MIDVIIPVYKPDEKFAKCLTMLAKQTVKPRKVICALTLTTDRENIRVKEIIKRFKSLDTEIIAVKQSEFDHGNTRNKGASKAEAEYMLFMTQDAVPADTNTLEIMSSTLDSNRDMAVCYARQLPNKKAGSLEKFTRNFNYPAKSVIKSKEDMDRLGIKTFFCSNVCAMYRADIFREMGGFIDKTIFNEDMIYASRIIKAGYKIGYVAEARVVHSHKYTYRQEKARNFDLGVSQKMYEEDFSGVKSESEGIKMVKRCMGYLLKKGEFYMIPDLIIRSGFKYIGYRQGKNYEKFSKEKAKKLSMNKSFWER